MTIRQEKYTSLYKETSILTTVHWIHFFFHCYNFAEEKSSKKLLIVKCQVPDKIFSSSVTMSVTTWCWLYITVLHAIFVWLDLVRNLTHIVRPQRATIQIEKTWSHFSNQIITLFFFFFMNQKSHPYPTTSVLLLYDCQPINSAICHTQVAITCVCVDDVVKGFTEHCYCTISVTTWQGFTNISPSNFLLCALCISRQIIFFTYYIDSLGYH